MNWCVTDIVSPRAGGDEASFDDSENGLIGVWINLSVSKKCNRLNGLHGFRKHFKYFKAFSI